jgi:hypothetical protein
LRELDGDTIFRREESFLKAIQKGRVEVVRQMLREGCDLNKREFFIIRLMAELISGSW